MYKRQREAGRLIKNAGIKIDLAFSSVLKRAIKTQHLLQEEADQMWIPEVHQDVYKRQIFSYTAMNLLLTVSHCSNAA